MTGDLVNGGPESAAVLRWAREYASGVVLGNHDLHLLAVEAGARPLRRDDTFRDVLDAHDKDELLRWLRQRPLVVEDSHFFLVHAGILPEWSQGEAAGLAAEAEACIREDGPEFFGRMYGDEPSRWNEDLVGTDRVRLIINAMTRMRMLGEGRRLDVDYKGPPGSAPAALRPWFEFPREHGPERKIFFGHWAACGLSVHERAVGLDSGCAWGRELTACRLEDGAIFQVKSELAGRFSAGR